MLQRSVGIDGDVFFRIIDVFGVSVIGLNFYWRQLEERTLEPIAEFRTITADYGEEKSSLVLQAPEDENELYEQWKAGTDDKKPEFEAKIYHAVMKHAMAIIQGQLGIDNEDVAAQVGADVVRQLSKFQGKSKFSTWVHGITKRQIA